VKIWEVGQTEPADWDLSKLDTDDVAGGSVLLNAHYVDVSFGDIAITSDSDTTPPVISNVQVTEGVTTATITWQTDEPATSRVDYGLTDTYGSFVEDLTLKTDHSIELTGLDPNTLYHYQITSEDAQNNPGTTADDTFTTAIPPDIIYVPIDYTTIQGAIDAAYSGNTIRVDNSSYTEDITLDEDINLTIEGGWDPTFSNQTSDTTINGKLTINKGELVLEHIILAGI
jgi:hypothetical protein